MRQHVRPADPAATIPDPSRGRPLPPDGLPVTWGPYWAGLAARDEIVVSEVAEDADPEASAPVEAPAAAHVPEGAAAEGAPDAPAGANPPAPSRKVAKPAA